MAGDTHESQMSKHITGKVFDAFTSPLTLPLITQIGLYRGGVCLFLHVKQLCKTTRERSPEYRSLELILQY